MLIDQDDTKAAKGVAKTLAVKAYSSAKKINRLESELAALRLDAIQVKYESAEEEIGCYIPHIQDLERAIFELRSAAYAKDEKLIAIYNQVIHFKKLVDRLEPQVLELQSDLKINESLKNEVEEL
ncbi:hypothetical protein ACFX2B_041561 [Malus domestica]